MVGAPVYLDSAELVDLRSLFEDGVHKSEVVVVLATRSYLTRPWCLLELWEASQKNIPVIVMPVAGRGYDKEDSRLLIRNLETELEMRNPGALDDIEDHIRAQARVTRMCTWRTWPWPWPWDVDMGHGDMTTWRHGDMATWRHGDMGTRGHGDMGTWGHGT